MVIDVVGVDFEDSLDNCGKEIKIVFQRAQSAKVRQIKLVVNNGVIIENKGEVYYVAFNITGSNDGTSKDTKFQLKMFFEKCLFLVIEKLVFGGCNFLGFDPVIQGDNDGTHQDAKFYKYVEKLCKAKKWMWEPQRPQMPHMNVLDLVVFPEISLHTSHFIRSFRGM